MPTFMVSQLLLRQKRQVCSVCKFTVLCETYYDSHCLESCLEEFLLQTLLL